MGVIVVHAVCLSVCLCVCVLLRLWRGVSSTRSKDCFGRVCVWQNNTGCSFCKFKIHIYLVLISLQCCHCTPDTVHFSLMHCASLCVTCLLPVLCGVCNTLNFVLVKRNAFYTAIQFIASRVVDWCLWFGVLVPAAPTERAVGGRCAGDRYTGGSNAGDGRPSVRRMSVLVHETEV